MKSRRKFLQDSLAGVTAASVLSQGISASTAISYSRIQGANRRIRVGLIGCGGQGTNDLRKMLMISNIECVALCDVDDAQVVQAAEMVDKQANQKPALRTRDFRKVIDDKTIDAVIIGTPDHWHALPTVAACQAGKDVYVEKPLSLTIAEGRVMVDVARRHNRIVQMGTQQRSTPHYKDAFDYA
ncbi:MAG TPA: Gfo/Idh/MocA family oxidoreductase, partial [Blastocatellia bacterium]|nr:Gfo/Idh/MocA family oxidoreductase [Blastocatellia bacterium]